LASGVGVTRRSPLADAHTKVERVYISTAILRAEERCFSIISEGDKEFGSLMLMSAG
jgi:hypothetical protein